MSIVIFGVEKRDAGHNLLGQFGCWAYDCRSDPHRLPPYPVAVLPRLRLVMRDRSIPEFARELDFLRLLPRGADVDPNDPRFGNVVLLRQLLASLGPGRHDSPFREHHTGCGSRTGPASLLGEITEHGGAATRGEEGEDNGVFRASQEQQVLVFAGRHPTVATGRGSSSGGGLGGGHGGVHSFAYNNHRR